MTERTEAVKRLERIVAALKDIEGRSSAHLHPDDWALLEAHLRQPGWVKCSERLPTVDEDVLLYWDYLHDARIGYWDGDEPGNYHWWKGDAAVIADSDPTHWQSFSLPTPPTLDAGLEAAEQVLVPPDLAEDIKEYLADHMDVKDGPYGEQRPNKAMQLHTELSECRTANRQSAKRREG